MLLHKNLFVEIIFEEENSLIVDKFLTATEKMSNSEFKEEMLIFANLCEKHRPKRELVHLIDMKYPISPEMQTWMNEVIFPRYQNIIKRMAFLMPTEIIPQLSVEQTMEEETGQHFVKQYFDNEEAARVWLLTA